MADLDDAYDYLSREATQETAEKQADAFNALFRRLLTFPYSGRFAEQYRFGLREAHTKRWGRNRIARIRTAAKTLYDRLDVEPQPEEDGPETVFFPGFES